MCDHHALGTRGGAAGVIDCKQIGLVNFRAGKFRRGCVEPCLVVEPALAFSRESDKEINLGKPVANAIDRFEIIAICADHARTTVINQINKIVGCQTII